jgi:hypothetical protein
MKSQPSLAHQVIADRLHAEAHWLVWRGWLIADRLWELSDIAFVGELALTKIDLADQAEVHNAVLTVRELLEQPAALLDEAEYDYAESACERVELALIALRRAARQAGVVL